MVCRIELLGGLSVLLPDRTVARFRTRKAALLLGYLACFARRRHPREDLLDLLWPEIPPDRARNSLSQALTSLRHQLEPPGVPAGAFLVADRETVGLDTARVATDLAEMERAFREAERVIDPAEKSALLARGIDLYRGPFLDGYPEVWVLEQQERLTATTLHALDRLLACLESMGDLEGALAYARRGVELDPLREETRRTLMRLLAASGERDTALREFEDLERRLRQELGAAPEDATRALAHAISRSASGDLRGRMAARSPDCPKRENAFSRERAKESESFPNHPSRSSLTSRVTDAAHPTSASRRVLTPSSPLEAAAGSLPLALTPFFGREEELSLLVDLLAGERFPERRLVTLIGPGGSGKTRLALEAARRLVSRLESSPSSPEVWFVPLAERLDGRHVIDAVRDTLRLFPGPDRNALDLVVGRLAGRRTLLVLDTFEHLVAEGAVAVRALLERVPALTCLVTSRCPLGLEGEQELFVPPLPVPEAPPTPLSAPGSRLSAGEGLAASREPGAESLLTCPSVHLFVDRAQAAQPDFQVTAGNALVVAELCRRLEGIPLAIELAAARARTVSPARMLEHMDHRFDFLVTRRRDAAVRHRTLWDAIDWSFRLLSPEQQFLFVRLSIFRGGWTAEAAARICADPAASRPSLVGRDDPLSILPAACCLPPPHERLAGLCDASLIIAEKATLRYRMLDSLREYGQAHLSAEEAKALARRHAEHFLALAQEGDIELRGPRQVAWQERLEAEHDNFRAALAWSQAVPEGAELGLGLVGALTEFWRRRGHWQEARRWCERALSNPHAARASPERAWALGAAAQLAWLRGDGAEARAWTEESLAICRAVNNVRQLASGTLLWGHVLADAGDGDGAIAAWREAERLFHDSSNVWGVALALNSIGDYLEMIGDEAAAAPFWNESAALFRRLGDLQGIGWCLDREARVASRAGEFDRARAILEEALAIRRALGHPFDLCASLRRLGKLSETRGDLAGARRYCEEALAIYGDLGATRYCRSILRQLIALAEAQGDGEDAARYRATRAALPGDQAEGEVAGAYARSLAH
jgi:predicted ATPase/DNA-binding SARP family transcriptional activator